MDPGVQRETHKEITKGIKTIHHKMNSTKDFHDSKTKYKKDSF